MTILTFIIASLATFRIATMVSQEKGPGFIFCKLRNAQKKGSAAEAGLKCPLCVSVYSSAFITTFLTFAGLETIMVVPVWLGLSGASVCLSLTVAKDL